MMEWISIRQGMPPIDTPFLAKNKDDVSICIMKILPHGKYEINNRDTGTGYYNMTHWMTLPE